MAYPYNNYYSPYQQYQPQYNQYPQQAQAPQNTNNGLIWVSGEVEARNYLVAPNNAVALWDSNSSAVYLKKADAAGKPTFQIFDLVERGPKSAPTTDEFVTRKEFDALAAKIDELRKGVEE